MISLTPQGYFDTSTLSNFAAIDRLGILEDRWGHRAVWTDAVRDEVEEGRNHTSYMAKVLQCEWLGAPLSFLSSELSGIQNIRARFSSVNDPPEKNLGEAELIFAILRAGGGSLITDDQIAASFARRKGITVLDTCDLMTDAFSMGTTGCPESYDVLRAMDAAGRQNVRIPSNHGQVC